MLAAGGGAAYAVPGTASYESGAKAGQETSPVASGQGLRSQQPGHEEPETRGTAYADGTAAKASAGMLGGSQTPAVSAASGAGGSAASAAQGTQAGGSSAPAAQGTQAGGSPQAASAAGSADRQQAAGAIADYALDQLGTPYAYGGASPTGFDASGFLYYVYRYSPAALNLPRTIAEQFKQGADVGGQSLLLPGDAVFFRSGSAITFAGIYTGNREFAAATVDGVKLSSLTSAYWQERYAGARRMTGTGTGSASSGSSGSGSGSESGLTAPDSPSGTLAGTAYFSGISKYLAAAKPVLPPSAYNRLEEKAELGLQQYEHGLYADMLESHQEVADLIEALPAAARTAIGIKGSEIYGSTLPAGLYDISAAGGLNLHPESGYKVTLMQQAAAEQLWTQVKAMYPKAYLSLIRQFRLEIKRGAVSRTETIGKAQVRLVLDPSDLTPGAKERTRWALAHELGRLVTQQGPGGSELDHLGSPSAAADGAGGIIGSAYGGPAPGSGQWAYFRKDSLMTRYYSKFWTPEVVRDARAGKPMTAIYTKLFFREASAYQAGEDIADAWAAFILYDKPIKPVDRRDEKVLFFYSSPELAAVRSEARKGMALAKSYPKTTTFADLIGPRTW